MLANVLARVGGVNRSLGALPRGWRQADLIEFERRLLELREQVLTGRTPPPTRPVTLDESWAPGSRSSRCRSSSAA